MIFSTKPSRREMIPGSIYLFLFACVMPLAVPLFAARFLPRLNTPQVNFLYFCINFIAVTVIFRKYLLRTLQDALRCPLRTLTYALFALLGSMMLGNLVLSYILRWFPEFRNVNDNAIGAMVQQNLPLMAIGAVFLAPVTEELLFRGLIFRGIYDRSPFWAYVCSMALFSLVHVSGYLGMYSWKLLALCFLQYLVPAYCLCFAYRFSGNLAAPILMHMVTNLVALSEMR